MVLTVAQAVKKRIPNATITARVPRVDFASGRREGLQTLRSDSKGFIERLWSKANTALQINAGTTLVDVSGFQFGDDWSSTMAERRAITVQRFMKAGNQVFFMPQAWGPFEKKPRVATAVRTILKESTLSYVRDRFSETAVTGLVGSNLPQVRFAHDLAWNFEAADPAIARQKLTAAGLAPGRLTICVTPNIRVYERAEGTGADNAHVKMMAAMIRHVCQAHGAQVMILGHELRNSAVHDDQYLGDILLDSVDKSLPVVHVKGPLRAAEIKALIGQCDLLLASRYHALIAALSQSIPVGVAGWSHKYTELIEETGGGHIFSHLDADDDIRTRLDQLISERQQIREVLNSRVPAIKASSREALDHVVELMEAKAKA